ncbi:MAG: CtsR family transcriptional regulator [Clostridia bacterium]|nr:CtsR family transcriptional regulator [Clostridia bacterium]
MRLSDIIAAYIQEQLEETDGSMELQRNVLAEELGCVPSQINYVLASRFGPEQGYIVESRRGGGGYIRITKVRYSGQTPPLVQLANAMEDTLDQGKAQVFLQNLLNRNLIDAQSARVLAVATSDRAYKDVPAENRDALRASMMKNLLIALSM